MKKLDTKGREAKAAQLRRTLEENEDLFEIRFLNQSTACVEWFEDVKDELCRFVAASSLGEKELYEKLADAGQLKLLLSDELRAHGVDDGDIDAIGTLSD